MGVPTLICRIKTPRLGEKRRVSTASVGVTTNPITLSSARASLPMGKSTAGGQPMRQQRRTQPFSEHSARANCTERTVANPVGVRALRKPLIATTPGRLKSSGCVAPATGSLTPRSREADLQQRPVGTSLSKRLLSVMHTGPHGHGRIGASGERA